FTTKETGKGTGLGLSQVYGFAKQSGGSVEIETEIGRGTTVQLLLPRSKTPSLPAQQAAARPPAHGAGRVLVVEDNDEVAVVTVGLVEQLGYKAERAETARQ